MNLGEHQHSDVGSNFHNSFRSASEFRYTSQDNAARVDDMTTLSTVGPYGYNDASYVRHELEGKDAFYAHSAYADPLRQQLHTQQQHDGFVTHLQPTAVPAGLLQWEAHAEAVRSERIWNAYLYGQSANVAKAAVWWSMFGTLVASLLHADEAVGISRAAFNVALVLSSPLAGAVSERTSIRALLNVTTFSRMLVWSCLVPLSWIVFDNLLSMREVFWVVFVLLMFFDGIQVAFANVVDIDCGGLETLSLQYNLPINDYIRNRFNSIHQMVFDLSFVLFTPPIAFLLLEVSRFLPDIHISWLRAHTGVASLQLGISTVFLILSLLSIWWYCSGLPRLPFFMPNMGMYNYEEEEQAPGDCVDANDSTPSRSFWNETRDRIRDVSEGFRIVIGERSLGWRLVFLALETALEDSMVTVVIPEIAIHTTDIFSVAGDAAVSNVWAVCIIAAGKIGGLLAGLYMSSRWSPPLYHSRNSAYRSLFWCVLISSLSVSLFPLSRYAVDYNYLKPTEAGALLFLGSFLFFVFSTAPKIGFATLLQSLVANQQVAGRVFGFVGTFVTIADALVILLINYIFVTCGPDSQRTALVIIAGVYLAHGVLEAFAGPILVLDSLQPTSRGLYPTSQSYPVAARAVGGNVESNFDTRGADGIRWDAPTAVQPNHLPLVLENNG